MKLYRTAGAVVLEDSGRFFPMQVEWDELINREDLCEDLRLAAATLGEGQIDDEVLPPIESQEVWAAGVTYFRSRTARIEESQEAGGGTFYDRVYHAARPELFFKSPGWRVRGHGDTIRVRSDAAWSVPEPELALYVNARAQIIGYTIGNDVSSRDIEGENPLYLPQAKMYDGSCALGPALLLCESPLPSSTRIELRIVRDAVQIFEGCTELSQMRRTAEELVEYLYRETTFPHGCVLLTGTGVVPPDGLSLRSGDQVEIRIPPIGVLRNTVE